MKIPHFIKKPICDHIVTVQEKLDTQRDIQFAKYYAVFFVSFFLLVSVARSFSQDPAEELPENVVDQISHKEIRGPIYTTRVGLGGSRKILPGLSGLTVEERTKEFLGLYGKEESFQTFKILSNIYLIDYTLPVCIAWADSHLGHALKSKNNIGNVGNNDRGDTVDFKTLDQGINAIFKTLNGSYLSKHTKVGELSNEGRIRLKLPLCKEGSGQYCYATSEVVWSTNVTNCLKALQNKNIEEEWQFRRK